MVDSKENLKFDLGIKGLRLQSRVSTNDCYFPSYDTFLHRNVNLQSQSCPEAVTAGQ